MNPEPREVFTSPKKRLPERKRMTVVIGIKSGDDIVMAADREESDSYLRYQVQKIKRFGFPGHMMVGVTGDGDAHFVDYSTESLRDYFLAHSRLSVSTFKKATETVLKKVFEEHIFATNLSLKERPDFGLLISCTNNGKSKLFKTKQAAPIEMVDFAASGYGASYAEILLQKLWGSFPLQSAVLLCLHVVQQTKKHVCTVGGGTDVAIFRADGKSGILTSALTKPLEEKLEKMDHEFDGALFSALYGGNWVRDANDFRDKVGKIRSELESEMTRLFEAVMR